MNKFYKYTLSAAVAVLLAAGFSSCNSDLDVTPINPELQTEVEPEQLFNKCYANFGLAGNGGSDGDCDVDGIDGGTSGLYRQMWNSNELTTDEAICGWGDEGINTFCFNNYDGSHPMLRGYYYRLCVGIAYCNQYLDVFSDHNATMTAEVRFLRAMQYYLMLDAYGPNIPFATHVSSNNPPRGEGTQVYDFIESELLDICDNGLSDAKPKKKGDAGYGRIDKAAAWMLLARLYLNAEVYTGTPQWAKARDYAKKVMDSPYQLNTQGSSNVVSWTENVTNDEGEIIDVIKHENETWEFTPYQMLFMGDNDITSAAYECIFPILSDRERTTSWGVSLYLIASTHDGDMRSLKYSNYQVNGVTGQAWGGNRARPELIKLFFTNYEPTAGHANDVYPQANDDRALFDTDGRTLDVNDVGTFKSGYAVGKFTNFTTNNVMSTSGDARMPNMDVFFMRKAEAYLTYAEALTRLNGNTVPSEAVAAINVIRSRAHAATKQTYNLNDILDEWGREFYFEGRRRVDLIRFNRFGGPTDYKWQWKGGVMGGRDFEKYRNIFAIPTTDVIANPNLQQNPGY